MKGKENTILKLSYYATKQNNKNEEQTRIFFSTRTAFLKYFNVFGSVCARARVCLCVFANFVVIKIHGQKEWYTQNICATLNNCGPTHIILNSVHIPAHYVPQICFNTKHVAMVFVQHLLPFTLSKILLHCT